MAIDGDQGRWPVWSLTCGIKAHLAINGNQSMAIDGDQGRWPVWSLTCGIKAHLAINGKQVAIKWQSMEIKGDGPSGRSQKCAGRARA